MFAYKHRSSSRISHRRVRSVFVGVCNSHPQSRSNHVVCFAQAVGGAALVHKDGHIVLLDSNFHANLAGNSSDGVGIVNLGGDVQCDAADCLPVCTECQLSSAPTKSPPTSHPTVAIRAEMKGSSWSGSSRLASAFVGGGLAMLSAGIVVAWRRRTGRYHCFAFDAITPVALGSESHEGRTRADSNEQPLLRSDTRTAEPNSVERNAVELVPSSVMLRSTLSGSPAPIFAIGSDLHIVLWSPVRTTPPSALSL